MDATPAVDERANSAASKLEQPGISLGAEKEWFCAGAASSRTYRVFLAWPCIGLLTACINALFLD
jgi:hypothetical protein